jgi:hypothetical protein
MTDETTGQSADGYSHHGYGVRDKDKMSCVCTKRYIIRREPERFCLMQIDFIIRNCNWQDPVEADYGEVDTD